MLRNREAVRYNKYKRYLKKSSFHNLTDEMKCCENEVVGQVNHCVVGPSLNGFVLWTLNEAIKSGKKRLYFLARDGYLMYQSAHFFCKKMNLPLECRYLSCSRYSIRIPMFHLHTDEALEYVCRGGLAVNLTKILSRAGLTKDEQEEVLVDLNLNIDKHEAIPYAKLKDIKFSLEKNRRFMDYMHSHSMVALPNLTGYLKQEGLLDEVEYAIVDSGWVGSMQKTLNQLLSIMGCTQTLEGYYWGLYELPEGVLREKYHCYYFSPEGDLREKVYFSNCLFEVIFTAPHGMTLEYKKDGERYVPVYGFIDEQRRSFISATEHQLKNYTQKLSVNNLAEIDYKKDKETIKKLLKLFMGKPTKAEAEVYGSCMFSDDVLEHELQPVAAALEKKELNANHLLNKALAMHGLKTGKIEESAWYEGSAVKNGQGAGYHIWQYTLYKYLLYLRKTYMWRRSNG